jgi:hypothetical protein
VYQTGRPEYARFTLIERQRQLTSCRTIDRLVIETMGLADLGYPIVDEALIRSLARSSRDAMVSISCTAKRHVIRSHSLA